MNMPPNLGDYNLGDYNRGLDLFLDLFNRQQFFDAHEVLEDVWRSLPRDRPSRPHLRLHIQGMVQLAVAFHHQSKGNYVGARSVLERAVRNLNGADTSFPDLDLDRLRVALEFWRRYLDDSEGTRDKGADDKRDKKNKKLDRPGVGHHTAPALPKIMRRR
jgi:hypothetical protein